MKEFIKEFFQPEELVIGAMWGISVGLCIGSCAWVIGGAWCAILWRLGGMGWLQTKLWRRLGVPIVLVSMGLLLGHKWALLGLSAFGPLTIGYGIPQTDTTPSWLGRVCEQIVIWCKVPEDKNVFMTNMLTRGICHLLTAICLVPTWL